MDDLLGHLDNYLKYLRYDKLGSELTTEELVVASKLYDFLYHRNLYMNEQYVEDSYLRAAFGGKYLIMKRCPSCNDMNIEYQDFLTLTFRGFRGEEDTNHVYSIRKEHSIPPAIAAGGWGLLKPFGSLYLIDRILLGQHLGCVHGRLHYKSFCPRIDRNK